MYVKAIWSFDVCLTMHHWYK